MGYEEAHQPHSPGQDDYEFPPSVGHVCIFSIVFTDYLLWFEIKRCSLICLEWRRAVTR